MCNSENKNSELLKFLEAFVTSGTNVRIHNEVAAWTYAGLYFTFILALYSAYFNVILNSINFCLICLVILLFLLLILILIHAQYGQRQANRAMYETYNHLIFKILNNDFNIDKSEWEIPENNTLPIFIKKEIDERCLEYHKITNILPGVSIFWVIVRILESVCKSRLNGYYKKEKINLIESTIYSILILHTVAFLLWFATRI